MITNQNISAFHNSSLAQVKRWSLALFGPDPAGGQSSGKRREFSVDEAIRTSIAGYYIKVLRFKIDEAVKVIEDISFWLLEIGAKSFSGLADIEDNFIFHITPDGSGNFIYEASRYDSDGNQVGNVKRWGFNKNLLVNTRDPNKMMPHWLPCYRVDLSQMVKMYADIYSHISKQS